MIDKDRNRDILSVYVYYFVETYLEIERKKRIEIGCQCMYNILLKPTVH